MRLRVAMACLLFSLGPALVACVSKDPAVSQNSHTADLIIANTTVIGGRGFSSLAGVDILVKGGEILAVEPHSTERQAKRVIDGIGKFVVPGYMDAHTHPFSEERRACVALPPLMLLKEHQ